MQEADQTNDSPINQFASLDKEDLAARKEGIRSDNKSKVGLEPINKNSRMPVVTLSGADARRAFSIYR